MRAETRSWVRRAQALVLICAVFIYIILIGDTEFLAEAGIARVDGPWMRRIAISRGIFILVCLALILVAFRLKIYTKEAFGFVAVSSVVNLVTDFPILFQLGLEDPSTLYLSLFVLRLAVSLLTVSLYLDFDNAPRDRRLSKTLFAIRFR
jgi:hypothetical protein